MGNQKRNKVSFGLWEVIIIALVSALIMSGVTGYITFRNKGSNYQILANNPYINKFLSSYNTILNNFHTEVDEQALIEAAIKGMLLQTGDPYTSFINQNNSEEFIDSIRGTFRGIGISLSNENKEAIIIHVFEDSPAEKAGILPGDIIRVLNEIEIQDKTTDEVIGLIRNSTTNNISITIERDEALINFNLTKALVPIPQVHSNVFKRNNQRVGYLRINSFSESVGLQFQRRLAELEADNIESLIIDLRDNTGGYLKGATEIASMFLREGSVLYQLRVRERATKERVTTNEARDYPIYILINNNSASASEILAAALRESHHGEVFLVGERSYGKGLIQTTSTLSSGAIIRYTNAEWLTPNGLVVEEVGLTPDIKITFNDEFGRNPAPELDNQLQKALYRISQR